MISIAYQARPLPTPPPHDPRPLLQRRSPKANSFQKYEYLELTHTGETTLDLTGATFTHGLTFTFDPASPITSLAAGARLVLVKNPAAFAERYGAGRPDPYPPHLPMTHAPFSSADPRKQIPFRNCRHGIEQRHTATNKGTSSAL
jgi:hypothetical protein